MNARQRTKIDAFVASGQQVAKIPSGAVLARQGPRFQTLVTADGERTAAGAFYEQKTSQDLPVGGFAPQAPQRSGDTEFITMRDGLERATRRWDPASQDYKFTKLGKSFYGRLKRNYVVQVPVKVTGQRKNGTTYTIRCTLPIAKLGVDRVELPLNLTTAQRTVRVKELVRTQLDLTRPLYEVSKETWEYDSASDGAWVIHEETVARDPDSGEMVVALDRRVGALPLSPVSCRLRSICAPKHLRIMTINYVFPGRWRPYWV